MNMQLAKPGKTMNEPAGHFFLSAASLSGLRYEHNLFQPVIRLWNDDHHILE